MTISFIPNEEFDKATNMKKDERNIYTNVGDKYSFAEVLTDICPIREVEELCVKHHVEMDGFVTINEETGKMKFVVSGELADILSLIK